MRDIIQRFAPIIFFVGLITLMLPGSVRAQKDAGKLFSSNCTVCHAGDGSGSSSTGKALKARDLRSDEVQKQSDAELSEVISKGKGKMPAFGSKLAPDDIKSLVAYIRQLAKK
jgi:cytochrome c6